MITAMSSGFPPAFLAACCTVWKTGVPASLSLLITPGASRYGALVIRPLEPGHMLVQRLALWRERDRAEDDSFGLVVECLIITAAQWELAAPSILIGSARLIARPDCVHRTDSRTGRVPRGLLWRASAQEPAEDKPLVARLRHAVFAGEPITIGTESADGEEPLLTALASALADLAPRDRGRLSLATALAAPDDGILVRHYPDRRVGSSAEAHLDTLLTELRLKPDKMALLPPQKFAALASDPATLDRARVQIAAGHLALADSLTLSAVLAIHAGHFGPAAAALRSLAPAGPLALAFAPERLSTPAQARRALLALELRPDLSIEPWLPSARNALCARAIGARADLQLGIEDHALRLPLPEGCCDAGLRRVQPVRGSGLRLVIS